MTVQPQTIYCLILPGFQTKAMVEVITQLRQQGMMTQLIGLSTNLVKGQYGINASPDASIDGFKPPPGSILMTFASETSSIFLTEPRIYACLQETLQQNGIVALLGDVARTLARLGFPPSAQGKQVIVQDQQSIETFINAVIARRNV